MAVASDGAHPAPIAVIGGGMAGCAACLALDRLGLAVTWIAPDAGVVEKPGESLAAAALPLLADLGVDRLLADPAHRQAHASFTSWGSAALLERHAAAQPGGPGHVLDRGRFEAGLVDAARQRTRIRMVERHLLDFHRTETGWTLVTDTGQHVDARFLIDASGRRALIGRRLGRFRRLDRLVAAYAFLQQVATDIAPTPATLLEAVDTGWWYATLLADRRMAINFYSDPDLMPRGIGSDVLAWRQLAERTSYISRWIESAGYVLVQPPRLATAGTAWLEDAAGVDWLAAGDAAASFDPLSAHGMTTALWMGIQAAEAASLAVDGDASAPQRYAARVRDGVAHFSRGRDAVYGRERRFCGRAFWQRRHGHTHERPPFPAVPSDRTVLPPPEKEKKMSKLAINGRALAVATVLGLGVMPAASAAERIAYPSPVSEGLPYSGAVRAGGMVYAGGVLGTVQGKSELVPGGIKAEARQAFAHMKNILEGAGTSMDRTVKCTVLLANIDDFPTMNEVFREVFPEAPPTRSTIIVPKIPLNAAIEVECDALAED
jgi:reactive intermediate/imine deaminase